MARWIGWKPAPPCRSRTGSPVTGASILQGGVLACSEGPRSLPLPAVRAHASRWTGAEQGIVKAGQLAADRKVLTDTQHLRSPTHALSSIGAHSTTRHLCASCSSLLQRQSRFTGSCSGGRSIQAGRHALLAGVLAADGRSNLRIGCRGQELRALGLDEAQELGAVAGEAACARLAYRCKRRSCISTAPAQPTKGAPRNSVCMKMVCECAILRLQKDHSHAASQLYSTPLSSLSRVQRFKGISVTE